MINNTSKVRVEQIFVVGKGLTATAPLNPKGTKFSNSTAAPITVNGNTFQAGEVMLEANQLGIYNAETMVAIDATSTVTTDQSIVLAIKRDESADGVALPERPFEISRPIVPINGVVLTGGAYSAPLNNTHVITNIVAADETRYKLTIAYNGRRTDILNARNQPASFPEFTTPDYTTLGYTAANALDHMLQGLIYRGLIDSVAYTKAGNQAVPIAIDSLGGGSVSGILISALTIGQTLNLGKNQAGEIFSIKITESLHASLQKLLVANGGPLPATAEIILVDKTIAGTGTSNVDTIVYTVVDDKLANYDKIAETKTSIKIGLTAGFAYSVTNTQVVAPFEGKGTGRSWRLYYESTDGLRRFDSTELSGLDGGAIHYPTPVDASKNYVSYIILSSDSANATNGLMAQSPLANIILVESTDTASKTAIEAVLNPYLASSAHTSFKGDGASATGVVIV